MTFTGINADGACNNHDPATQGFTYNHTMLRVKDPAKSLDFYTRILGMTLVRKSDYEGGKFSLYFLVMLRGDEQIPADEQERRRWIARQSGVLELTHNAAIRWFDANHVPYQKRPEEGTMRDIAFIKDPDGYWVEIIRG